MKGSKKSITTKVAVSYILFIGIALFAILFIYKQIPSLTNTANDNSYGNQKLLMVSNALANLYEAETVGRTSINTGSAKQFRQYKSLMDTINNTIDSLNISATNPAQKSQLDSIQLLLERKTTTIKELIALQRKEGSKNYYKKAIDELIKADIIFEDYENDPRLEGYDPYKKKVIVDLLEYIREDNTDLEKNSDSLAYQVKNTLEKLNQQNKKTERTLLKKEASLLESDKVITAKLRRLLSDIEKEEIHQTLQKTYTLESNIRKTSNTLTYAGIASIVLLLAFLLLIARDLKKRQQYEKQLEKSKQYAETVLKSKEQLMATVTHDLRSPLHTIVGYTRLLENTSLDSRQNHYLGHLRKSSDFTLHLVNDLLDLSKLNAGKLNVEAIKFNLKKLVADTFKELTSYPKNNGVTYTIGFDTELADNYFGDPFRLKQILANLLTNAIKFTQQGSIDLKCSVKKKTDKESIIKIALTDTGIGIAKNKREAIFQEFTQADQSIEQKYGGSGLGLTITKKLTHLLNGAIYLESTEGVGSTFTLEIPFSNNKSQDTPNSSKPEHDKNGTPLKTVLIIDDDLAQLSLTEEILKPLGIKTETYSSPKKALSRLKDKTFDLVFTDIQMPGIDGFELISQIRAANDKASASIPVIALSGKVEVDNITYKKAGFTAKLTKPFLPEKLLRLAASTLKLDYPVRDKIKDPNHPILNERLFDFSSLIKFTQGDDESLNRILSVFMSSTQENVLQLKLRVRSKPKTSEIAHKMLPMFKQLDIGSIVPLLDQLEKGDLNLTKRKMLVNEIDQKINFLIAELNESLPLSFNTV